jgi:hypothetical protein
MLHISLKTENAVTASAPRCPVRYCFTLIVVLCSASVALPAQEASQASCRDNSCTSNHELLAQAGVPRQVQLPQDPMQPQDPQFGRDRQRDPSEEKMEHEREKALNKQRQTNLQKDSDRLLQLATELKQYVDKTNEHTLSLDVIKKAEEIERLAKSVKDKMRGSY